MAEREGTMRITIEFDVDEQRKFKRTDLEEFISGEMSAFEEFVGAGVEAKVLSVEAGEKGKE
jgi:hypothetical protein